MMMGTRVLPPRGATSFKVARIRAKRAKTAKIMLGRTKKEERGESDEEEEEEDDLWEEEEEEEEEGGGGRRKRKGGGSGREATPMWKEETPAVSDIVLWIPASKLWWAPSEDCEKPPVSLMENLSTYTTEVKLSLPSLPPLLLQGWISVTDARYEMSLRCTIII